MSVSGESDLMSGLKFTVDPLPDGTWRAEARLNKATVASCRDLDAAFALRVVEERAKTLMDLRTELKETLSSDNSTYWAEVLRKNPGKLCHAKPLTWNRIYAWLCWVPWEWLTVAAFIIGLTALIHWE